MSSWFPPGNPQHGVTGGSAPGGRTQLTNMRFAGGGGVIGKRSLTEAERMQLQQAEVFLRNVRQRGIVQQQQPLLPPISPISSADSSSLSIASSAIPMNSSYVLLQQQQQLMRQRQQQQQMQHQMLQMGKSVPFPSNSEGISSSSSAVTRSESDKMSSIRNQLHELERTLFDDDDDDENVDTSIVSCSGVTSSDWSETMEAALKASAPQHQQKSAPAPPLPTSPSTTTTSSSSSSSSCTQSSPAPSKQLLLDAAAAIADGNNDAAAAALARLKQGLAATPTAADPDQRLAGYMVPALLSRIDPVQANTPYPVAELCSGEHLAAAHMVYEFTPCFNLGLVAANLSMLEAARVLPRVHIVDFDIGRGIQYASLLNSLASLPPSAIPTVRITAVVDPQNPYSGNTANNNTGGLKLVGERLAKAAERAGISLRFSIVTAKTSDLTRAALGCEADEAVIVNFAFVLSRIADESVTPANPRDELLRRVKALGPRLVTVVEQEMSCNTAPFLARFAEASAHYRAVFESLEATTMGSPAAAEQRARLEACLGQKAANAVAAEGWRRVERCEVFGKWKARMGMAGFKQRPVGSGLIESVSSRLASGNPGFAVREEGGGVVVGWKGRVITVASSWH